MGPRRRGLLRQSTSCGMAMSRIFWDTNLFIYLFEDKSERSERVSALRQRMIEREDELLTSALTLGEILIKPKKMGNDKLAQFYELAISAAATVLPFDSPAALKFAEIRQDRSIQAPDAIQLACASVARADLFITNDNRLTKKNIHGIQFIQSLENAVL
ncbi:MAG: PIN domain-containing protein [Candidatus Dadabacteria bacterium]|nr:PIN domain-containing protein [Candidatus Dadabacteria bacterium]MYE60685.1 PIN domain-containing protein [Candidatus Dadabacteria bacterium]